MTHTPLAVAKPLTQESAVALQLLAIKATRSEVEAIIIAAGAEDKDGEIGYDAYVQAMSAQLFTGLSRRQGAAAAGAGLLSFDIQVNEYKR